MTKGFYFNPPKWKFYWWKIKFYFTKWKLVNTHDYFIIPKSDRLKFYYLSDKEFNDYQRLIKEKGNCSIEFIPGGGIGIGVYANILKTGEKINITDYNCW